MMSMKYIAAGLGLPVAIQAINVQSDGGDSTKGKGAKNMLKKAVLAALVNCASAQNDGYWQDKFNTCQNSLCDADQNRCLALCRSNKQTAETALAAFEALGKTAAELTQALEDLAAYERVGQLWEVKRQKSDLEAYQAEGELWEFKQLAEYHEVGPLWQVKNWEEDIKGYEEEGTVQDFIDAKTNLANYKEEGTLQEFEDAKKFRNLRTSSNLFSSADATYDEVAADIVTFSTLCAGISDDPYWSNFKSDCGAFW